MANSQRAIQKQMKESFSDLKDTATCQRAEHFFWGKTPPILICLFCGRGIPSQPQSLAEVTEGFDQVQQKLDANRKAIQKQMTDRFNAVDQKLVHVQGREMGVSQHVHLGLGCLGCLGCSVCLFPAICLLVRIHANSFTCFTLCGADIDLARPVAASSSQMSGQLNSALKGIEVVDNRRAGAKQSPKNLP